MFGRKATQTHSEQLRNELNESYGHLRMAAGHAAGGAAERLTPPYDRARSAANRGWQATRGSFEPLYSQVREGAAQAREKANPRRTNKTPLVIGLLAAGAAAGAAGALVMRRRKAANQWDDYEPLGELDTGYGLDADTGHSTVSSAKTKVSHGVASVADGVANQAGKVADSLRSSSPGSSTGASMGSAVDSTVDKTRDSMADAADKTADKAAEKSKQMKDDSR